METFFFSVGTPIYNITNWASCICAILTFTYIILLRIIYPECVNRVSLKLQTAIAFFDIIRHLINIYNGDAQGATCKFLGFLFFFCQHINTFLNVAIALNLQIIYLHERIPRDYFKSLLYTVPFIAAIVIDVIPFTFDGYGRSGSGRCANKKGPDSFIVDLLLSFITNYPGLIYCFIISICIIGKILLTTPVSESIDEESQSILEVQDSESRHIIFRISLYPLTSFLCHMGQILAACYAYSTHSISIPLTIWDMVGTSLVGAVNMICFAFDPYIQHSFYQIKNSRSGNNSISERTALLSSNTSEGKSNTASSSAQSTSNQPDKPRKKVDFNPVIRYYSAPIPIPSARSPDEHRREVWHTTDLHLHPKKFFRTQF